MLSNNNVGDDVTIYFIVLMTMIFNGIVVFVDDEDDSITLTVIPYVLTCIFP